MVKAYIQKKMNLALKEVGLMIILMALGLILLAIFKLKVFGEMDLMPRFQNLKEVKLMILIEIYLILKFLIEI